MHSVADTFSASYEAEPEAIGCARAELSAYASAAGFDGSRLADLRLAVSEAVTNAVLHAYGGAPGDVQVTGELGDGALWIRVRDTGRGMRQRRETATPGLGLGLYVIAQLVDGMTLEPRRPGGTDLRMRFDLATTSPAAQRGVLAA
jgi:anti-sigma regulatory factor (Ser/Thr protein kinase)